jgi:hypothetical protein
VADLLAVDRQRLDRQDVVEVELDLVGVGRRAEREPLGRQQRVGLRRPGQGELVVQGVDQRVAHLRVDRVLARLVDGLVHLDVDVVGCRVAARRPGRGRPGGRAGRRASVDVAVVRVVVATAHQGQDEDGRTDGGQAISARHRIILPVS